ncbi:MAG: glycosyltransferase [Flavobacteriales bacterium]|nr:glycosyltransferase [Flavobacteriales bacterium]
MSQQTDITVVIPVFNSVETLRPVYERTAATIAKLGKSFEVLFVEDGGPLESWNELKSIKKAYPDTVSLIRLGRNYGQNAATVCGITNARGGIVITMDDDLQTPPEEIGKLLEHYQHSDSAVVFGITPQQNNPFFKRLGSYMIKKIFDWVDGADIGSSFRLISPEMKEKLNKQAHDQLFLNQVIHWYTDEIGKVEVEHHSRNEGRSGYSFLGLTGIAIKLIFFYTDFPLRMMSVFGLLTSLICFGLGAYYIYEKIMIGTEAGFASIITAIFFATGLIILCLSILGAYISRIYADRIRKPVYSIKTRL